MTKIAVSGSISQRHGSADPDPHQNIMGSATLVLIAKWLQIYRGKLVEAEDNMNSQMSGVTVTFR
jgi:hypothetical protein